VRWPWQKKPPEVPAASSFVLLKAAPNDGDNYIRYQCKLCRSKWKMMHWDVQRQGLICSFCGAYNKLATVQYWMRTELSKQGDDICLYCFKGAAEHAGNKCLFGPNDYTPRGPMSS